MPLKRVFLCHSSIDKPFVDRLALDLERVNVGVWYDKWEIRVGDSLIEKIQQGLVENDYLVIILSPYSVQSDWVKKELNSALMREITEKKIFVLPCLLLDCEIPVFLTEKKYADFKTSYEEGFTNLLLAIFPESKAVVIHSKDFRVVQYLLSGLTSTDDSGSNILNAAQLKKVYVFKNELKKYLGLDEKRLIFWSALAFKKTSPDTPSFINNHVPIWGLINEIDELTIAKWIIEGVDSYIFNYAAKYFDWALSVNSELNITMVKVACINAHESKNDTFCFLNEHLLKLFAKRDPEPFKENYISEFYSNHPAAPLVINATTELTDPLNDDFYLAHLKEANENLAASIIKALVQLKKPLAIDMFREHYSKLSNENDIFNIITHSIFIPKLDDWFRNCIDVKIKAKIWAAIGNCGGNIQIYINDVIETLDDWNIYFIVRTMGCYGDESNIDFLINHFKLKDPILCETIIYALEQIQHKNCLDQLRKWFSESSTIIKAAALESIAKHEADFVNNEIENLSQYEKSPYLLSALIRSVGILNSNQWKEFLEPLYKHNNFLIRLCSARTAANMADSAYLATMLDNDDTDDIVKSVFDEKLYSKNPFSPNWMSGESYYDAEIARLEVRLTWPNQRKVYFQSDINRKIDFLRGRIE